MIVHLLSSLKNRLPRVSDFREIDSLGYLTPWRLTRRGIRPRGDWLAGVSNPGEIYSLGYQTPGRLTHRGIRPQGDWLTGVSDPANWGQVQLFFGPRPITQAVVVWCQCNLYFWNLHSFLHKWCENKLSNPHEYWENMFKSCDILYLLSL